MGQRIVIIGAGQAACSMAAKCRNLDKDASITIIGDETHLPYQRPPLSKKYATGELALEALFLRPPVWYQSNDIQVISGHRAVGIDPAIQTVTLDDKRVLGYDRLALTTGTRPIPFPPALGGDLNRVYPVRSIDDVDRFRGEMVAGARVLIIGGGYIGLEAAAVFSKAGLHVHVIEMADRILQRVACAATSDYFRALHTDQGVIISENTGVERLIGQDGTVVAADLSDGRRLDVDFVLVGIGVHANDDLAKDAGIAVDGGILVDEFAQTSQPDIYAAGDCARFAFRGQNIRLESVQNAVDQAEAAASNMMGEKTEYRPNPWFWSDQYGVKLQIAGLNLGYTNTVMRAGAKPGSQSIWYFNDKTLVSVDAMNDPRSFMVAKRLLADGIAMQPEQAEDAGFDLKSLL